MRRRAIPWLMVLLVSAPALPAWPFVVATSAADPSKELHWEDWVVPYTIDFHGSDDAHDLLVHGAFHRAFETWGEVTGAGLQFQELSTYADRVSEPEGVDLLYWIEEDWPHEPKIIALTSINYYPDTGQIVDVDIAFNGDHYEWSVLDDAIKTDLQSIATHEIGHLFGLDHAGPLTVMGDSYDPGETRQRVLTEDDIEGISYLYPCADAAEMAEINDHKAAAAECQLAFYDPGPCAVGRSPGRAGLWIVGALALALALLRRSLAARVPLLLWGVALACAPPAAPVGASMTPYTSLDAVVRDAAAVVIGTVAGVEPHWADMGRHVHSRVTVRVDRYLRGNGPSELTVESPAGELPELGTYVPGEPRFVPGRRVVLALSDAADGDWRLQGMAHGYAEIVDRDGATYLRRRPGGAMRDGDDAGVEWLPFGPTVERIRSLP